MRMAMSLFPRETGLTQRPLTTSTILENFPVMHSYIRTLSWFEIVVYCVNANVRKIGLRTCFLPGKKKRIDEAKKVFQCEANKGPLNMRLDCPEPHGSGGSTDTAETARRFFKAENCQHVANLVKGTTEERDVLSTLHKNIGVVLRVVNSKSRRVDTDSLQELCLKTYLEIAIKFPWASITTSLHRLLGHSAECININDGFGLGDCSEEGLETLHKLVRRF
jgi:hypothetical protein